MARNRKKLAINAGDFVKGMRDAISPGTAPDPETQVTNGPEPEPEADTEALHDLFQERTRFYSRLDTKCSWCGSAMSLENVRAGQRVACPKVGCNGGVTIGERSVRYETDVNLLPENIQLPGALAAAFQTERPLLAGWLNRALSAEEAAAIGHAFGVLLEHNRRLGTRVHELEHHLDLLACEMRQQVSVARGLEATLSRIHRFTHLPVDPDVWPPG
jgi:hypothetical protein